MATGWKRIAAVEEPDAALHGVEAGERWVVVWCAGARRHNTRSWEATEAEKREALAYVQRSLIGERERDRLARKAARKGRTRTVVLAERWADEHGRQLLVFWEGGPYPLPGRDDPERV